MKRFRNPVWRSEVRGQNKGFDTAARARLVTLFPKLFPNSFPELTLSNSDKIANAYVYIYIYRNNKYV